MIPLIKWSDDLLLHVDELDDQHRNLFLIINRLIVHRSTHRPRAELMDLIQVLVVYSHTHFRTEESHMADVNYPHIIAHKKEHATFSSNLKEFLEDYSTGVEGLTAKMLTFLRHWWAFHIAKSDQKFGKFLRDEGYLP